MRIITAFFMLLTVQAHAADWEESFAVGALFKSAELTGTFVLYDVSRQTLIGR